MGINELTATLGAVNNGLGSITPTTAAVLAGGAGLAVGAGAGAGIMAITRRKKTRKRKKATSTKSRRRKTKRSTSRQRKRARGGSKKIHYTKNHQPYILLASGKARFIKKKSAKRSKKLKGGYY